MNEEQIWQQIDLKNSTFFDENSLKSVSDVLSCPKDYFQSNPLSLNNNEYQGGIDDNEFSDEENLSDMMEDDLEDEEILDEEDDLEEEDENTLNTNEGKKSVLDDDFFNLNEMNNFLDAEDKKENNKHSKDSMNGFEDIDMFIDAEEVEETCNIKYRDFFKTNKKNISSDELTEKRKKRKLKIDSMRNEDLGEIEGEPNDEEHPDNREKLSNDEVIRENENENDIEDNDELTINEIRELNLKAKIDRMEAKALRDKPWQLKGEIDAKGRPINSLLEEVLDFDSSVRPAPVITEETTLKLEDIIRQRIKDKAFDDVVKRSRPDNTPQEFSKKLILNQEKSKESLVKIYENEFIEKNKSTNTDNTIQDVPKEHQEIKNLMDSLFAKLDALSNLHYTPNHAKPEVRIITNAPAILLEDVTPAGISTSTLLKPEEIGRKRKNTGNELGKDERSRTDKNRELRKKKMKLKHSIDNNTNSGNVKISKSDATLKKVINKRNTHMVKLLFNIKLKIM